MKTILYSAGAGAILGALVIWYFFPRYEVQVRTETKVVTEYKTKVVERWRKNPDGSEERERTEESSGNSEASKIADTKVAKHNWTAGISAGLSTTVNSPIYGVRLERRIVGPIFAGAYATTNKEAGVSLGLEF